MTGRIVSEFQKYTAETLLNNAELMCCTMRKCMNSWFERHKSSSTMTMGTTNQQPTFEKLRNESYVRHLYEVGLLQSVIHPVLGMSPDGIVILEGETSFDKQIGCLDIKTRMKVAAIAKAEESRREYVREV